MNKTGLLWLLFEVSFVAQNKAVPSLSTFSNSKYTFLWFETFCLLEIWRRINWAKVKGKRKYCLKLAFFIEGQFSSIPELKGVLTQNR